MIDLFPLPRSGFVQEGNAFFWDSVYVEYGKGQMGGTRLAGEAIVQFAWILFFLFVGVNLAVGGCRRVTTGISESDGTGGDGATVSGTNTGSNTGDDTAGDVNLDTIADSDAGMDTKIDTDTVTHAQPKVAVYVSYVTEGEGELERMSFATNESGVWVIEDTGIRGNRTSLALDASGQPHIGYGSYSYFIDRGLPIFSPGPLYVRKVEGSWKAQLAGDGCSFSSIGLDSMDKAHLVYLEAKAEDWDAICSTTGYLMYSTDVKGQRQWAPIGDTISDGCGLSMALDRSDKVHISYSSYTDEGLAYVTNLDGTWVQSVIDSSSTQGGYAGIHNDLALDSQSKVHISYYYSEQEPFLWGLNTKELRYATNQDGGWVTTTVATVHLSDYPSGIALDSKDRVYIVYVIDYGEEGGDVLSALGYVTNASGTWEAMEIKSGDFLVMFPSLAIDAGDKLHIVYAAEQRPDYGRDVSLRYITNVSGAWVSSTVDVSDNISFPSMVLNEQN